MGIADRAMGNVLKQMLPQGIDPQALMQTAQGMAALAQQYSERMERIEENQVALLNNQDVMLANQRAIMRALNIEG